VLGRKTKHSCDSLISFGWIIFKQNYFCFEEINEFF